MFYIALGLGVGCVTAYNFIRIRRLGWIGFFSKILSSLLFLLAGIFAGAAAGAPGGFYASMVGGLAMGFVGDIVLDLPYFVPKYRSVFLVGGIICFSAGHVLYCFAAFLTTEPDLLGVFVPIAVAFVLSVVVVCYVAPAMGLDFKRLDFAVLGYVFLLFLMIGAGVSVSIATGFELVWPVFFMAGLIFAVSDAARGRIFFGRREGRDLGYTPTPRLFYLINHAAYHPAQYLLAICLLLI
ncbi:MAG: lysoplasmalogenase family protein [Clostridiales bacterium]|nr:lysoplasmalogenase family protein [Clostridiales bacterium]